MSYQQAIRWSQKHPKGTRQTVIMHTGSGFWPAEAWLRENYWPYLDACAGLEVEPLACEAFYRKTTAVSHYQRTPADYAAMTAAGTL